MIEEIVKLRAAVRSAMVYPVAVIVIAIGVVWIILWKVIPTFAALFKGLGKNGKIEYVPMPEDLRGRYQYHTAADMSRLYATGFTAFADRFDHFVSDYVANYLARGYRRLQDD